MHPGEFVANLDPDMDIEDAMALLAHTGRKWIAQDFRSVNLDRQFDVVVFDPPYVSMGGRATSTLPDFMDRFGLENAESTPEKLQTDNNLGLAEAWRICKPGGLVIAKCAPYISSGVRKDGDWWTRDAALELGFEIHDMLIHLGDVRAQPKDNPCRKCGSVVKCTACNTTFPVPLAGGGALPVHHPNEPTPTSWQVCHGTGTTPNACEKCDGTGRIPRKVKHARNNYSVAFILRRPPIKKRRKSRKKATT
jgi:hypothetical protein